MNIQITFTGETIEDVVIEAEQFANAFRSNKVVFTPQAEVADTVGPDVPKPAPKSRAKAKTAPATASEPDPGQPAPTESINAEIEKAAKKALEDALSGVRKVYTSGADGQTAVKKLAKDFGVKKLADVPLNKTAELLAEVQKLEGQFVK